MQYIGWYFFKLYVDFLLKSELPYRCPASVICIISGNSNLQNPAHTVPHTTLPP